MTYVFSTGSLLAVSETQEDSKKSLEDDQKTASLNSINVVAAYEPFIEDARSLVTTEMENMVLRGLTTLVGYVTQPWVRTRIHYLLESKCTRFRTSNSIQS